MFASIEEKCPVYYWLAIMFTVHFFDQLMREYAMRMKNSIFWDRHRKWRQAIIIPVVVCKETFEISWVIYGFTLDRSKCDKDTGGLNIVFIMF